MSRVHFAVLTTVPLVNKGCKKKEKSKRKRSGGKVYGTQKQQAQCCPMCCDCGPCKARVSSLSDGGLMHPILFAGNYFYGGDENAGGDENDDDDFLDSSNNIAPQHFVEDYECDSINLFP